MAASISLVPPRYTFDGAGEEALQLVGSHLKTNGVRLCPWFNDKTSRGMETILGNSQPHCCDVPLQHLHFKLPVAPLLSYLAHKLEGQMLDQIKVGNTHRTVFMKLLYLRLPQHFH